MLIIKEGTVIPGDGTTVLDEATVYIDGSQIIAVKEGGPGWIAKPLDYGTLVGFGVLV